VDDWTGKAEAVTVYSTKGITRLGIVRCKS
jgi:hypothetical protein